MTMPSRFDFFICSTNGKEKEKEKEKKVRLFVQSTPQYQDRNLIKTYFFYFIFLIFLVCVAPEFDGVPLKICWAIFLGISSFLSCARQHLKLQTTAEKYLGMKLNSPLSDFRLAICLNRLSTTCISEQWMWFEPDTASTFQRSSHRVEWQRPPRTILCWMRVDGECPDERCWDRVAWAKKPAAHPYDDFASRRSYRADLLSYETGSRHLEKYIIINIRKKTRLSSIELFHKSSYFINYFGVYYFVKCEIFRSNS